MNESVCSVWSVRLWRISPRGQEPVSNQSGAAVTKGLVTSPKRHFDLRLSENHNKKGPVKAGPGSAVFNPLTVVYFRR
jgi:hypothetical protein